MKNIYFDTRILDAQVRKEFQLSEEIMMENAANSILTEINFYIAENQIKNPKILILCGSGNNGADGFTLGRKLSGNYSIFVAEILSPKSELAKIQKKRLILTQEKIYIIHEFVNNSEQKSDLLNFINCNDSDLIIVDCVFGSGFYGEFSEQISLFFEFINSKKGYKIACDIPSGLFNSGKICKNCFRADLTISMGGLKAGFFTDEAKDVVGKLQTAELGISELNFQKNADYFGKVLEKSDLKLPVRKKNFVNKGNFGHCSVICGNKIGAAVLSAYSSLIFGAGLSTLVCDEEKIKTQTENFKIPVSLMISDSIPEKTNSIVFGPGFGLDKNPQKYFDFLLNNPEIACVLDADSFYFDNIVELLKNRPKKIILTPHPKEFANLLKICNILKSDNLNSQKNFTVSDVADLKFELVELFCREFPDVVLILKGSNPIIATFSEDAATCDWRFKLFINPLGSASLAKAGSGDVLSGLCASLMAQNYSALDSAISASIAHSLASNNFKNNFALTPEKLIENIENLTL